MGKIKSFLGEHLGPVLLVCVTLGLLILLALTHYLLATLEEEQNQPSPMVLSFLEEYLPMRSSIRREECLNKYFSCIDAATLDSDGESQTQRDLNAVFWVNQGGAVGYRLCNSSKHYMEVMLVSGEGADLPCRIGIFYNIGGDGRISKYSIMRLLPVSSEDPEWSEVWRG